jgi:type IV secretion system protein VirD4
MLKEWNIEDTLNKGGIVFGRTFKKNILKSKEIVSLNDDDVNTLVIGSAGSGKTRRVLIPSVWELAKAGESMVITDRRGEILTYTYDYLKEQGYNVIVMNFDVLEPQKGNQFNILNDVIKAAEEGNISKAIEIAWSIAYSILGRNKKYNTDKIWIDGEAGVIAGLILLTVFNSDFICQKHMNTVYNLLSELGQVKEDETIPLIEYINSLSVEHPAKEAFKILVQASCKTRASIIATTLADIELFSDSNIANITSKQDHEIEKIGIEKTAVFLLFEDWRENNSFLVNFYLDNVFSNMIDLSTMSGGRTPRTVNILIDDIGSLDPINGLDLKLSIAPTRGIKFMLSIQAIMQLKKIYKESADIILDNCSDIIFLKTVDIETANFLSKKAGKIAGKQYLLIDEYIRWDITQSFILSKDKEPLKILLPDISEWTAYKELGFIKDKSFDKEMNHNREVIERRKNNIPIREIEEFKTWFPKWD